MLDTALSTHKPQFQQNLIVTPSKSLPLGYLAVHLRLDYGNVRCRYLVIGVSI